MIRVALSSKAVHVRAPTASVRAGSDAAGPPRARRQAAGRLGLAVAWSPRDLHRAVTVFAFLGLGLGAVMAVFGLPPLDLHTPLHHLGVMDPACGMTRGVRLTLRGALGDAVRYNPASPLVVVGGAAVVVRHVVGMATGRWLAVTFRPRPGAVIMLTALVGMLWVNQQHHAALLLR